MPAVKRPRQSFTFDYKLRVITLADEIGNRAAAREFEIDESMIRYWRKKKIVIGKVNETLTNLNLSYTRIGDAGAASIAEAIKVNNTLTNLNLSDNGISDTGARSFADAIKVNKMLANLNLSVNHISDDGATSIVDAIKVSKTLTNLNLSSNYISDAGARFIGEAIKAKETDQFVLRWY